MRKISRKLMTGAIAALAILTIGTYSVRAVTNVSADDSKHGKIISGIPTDMKYSALLFEVTEIKNESALERSRQKSAQETAEVQMEEIAQTEAETVEETMNIPQETQAYVPTQKVSTSAPIITDTNQTMWSTTALNVRSGCGASFPAVGTLSCGQAVTVTGVSDNGWYRIDFNGTAAYVKASYLQNQEIAAVIAQPVVQNTAPVYSGRILLEGGASPSLATLTESYLARISPSIVNAFFNSGWKITVTAYDIASTYYGNTSLGTLAGLTMTGRSQIYLTATSGSVQRATVHEFGHAFDCMNGFPSQSQEFISIFNEEKAIFGSGYMTSNYYEYFAECFNKYFSGTLGVAPRTYEFMNRLASQY